MKRLILALGAIALVSAVSSPAGAAYNIVRWSYGDCKIWHIDGPGPWGTDWKLLNKKPIKTWDAAWARLGKYQKKKICS